MAEIEPVFFLSTGRTGTKLVTEILRRQPRLWVEHNPRLELAHESYLTYQQNADLEWLKAAVIHARMRDILMVAAAGYRYVETNNRITLYAPALAELMPRARFVHLVRHPGEFVRSGVRRGYYSTMIPELSGHIEPRADESEAPQWSSMSQIGKIAWQWNTINQEIEAFKATLDSSRCMFVRSNDVFGNPKAVENLVTFCGGDPKQTGDIARLQNRKINAQSQPLFPNHRDWPAEWQADLKRYAPLAVTYEFSL